MLATLFKNALNTTVSKSVAVFFDYNDSNDFSTLWTADKNGFPKVLADNDGAAALVLVWDGLARAETSRAEKLLEPVLTPLDWALALSNAAIEKNAQVPDLRIHIIDLTSKKFQEAWAIRMRHQLLAEMPWVTLHAPLIFAGEMPAYREGYRPILEGSGLMIQKNGGWELVQKGKSLSAGIREGRGKGLKDLANQWVASLTQSDDHHDINNVIGPDILAKAVRRRKGLFGAFLTRLEWSGHDLEAASKWRVWNVNERIKKDLFDRSLCAYAVDDHLQQGWARFLCRLINGEMFDEASVLRKDAFAKLNSGKSAEQKIKLFGCQSPLPLIEFLRKKGVFDRRNYGGQLSDGIPCPELIFLDLRLYAGIEEAREQTRKLLDIIQRKLAAGLAWRAIDPEEIRRIRDWSNGASDDARIADEALLLLPRLLALALPLTPIILFSSTGQAWIRERLKPYQNIFTGFEKPRVLSDPTSIEASTAALREGLNKTVGMMRLRLQLAHAQLAAKEAEAQRPNDDQRISNHHVELYADETRSLNEGITSGLAVSIFANITAAETLQDRLCVEHGKSGTVWAKISKGARPQLSKGSNISKNDNECEQQTTLLAELLDSLPCRLAARDRALWSVVAMRMPAITPATAGPVSLTTFPDGPLDEALRFNLEFTLYGLLPYFSKDENVGFSGSIQIHLPTRAVPYLNKAFAKELCEAFDLGEPFPSNNGTWLVSSAILTSRGHSAVGSAFPLVRGWLHEWRDTSPGGITSRITKIKMTGLSQGTDGGITPDQARSRRLFHDVADWVCTASGQLHDTAKDEWVWPLKIQLMNKNVFPRWFISTDGKIRQHLPSRTYWFEVDTENALTLMRALKSSFRGTFEDGSETDSLRMVLQNSYVETCNPRLIDSEYCAQQRVILWMLRREVNNAPGQSLHALLVSDSQPLSFPPIEEAVPPPAIPAVNREPLVEDCPNVQEGDGGQGLAEATDRGRQEDSLPDLFDDAARIERFRDYGVYVVVRSTRRGNIFLKPLGDSGTRGTHWTHNKSLAFELHGEGWSDPRTVLGIEPTDLLLNDPVAAIYAAATARSEKSLRVVAAKLADGQWKFLGS